MKMLAKILSVFLLLVSSAFAQNSNFDSHYQAAEKAFDAYNGKTGSQESGDSKPTFSSPRPSSEEIQVPISILVLPAKNAKNLSELEIVNKNPYSRALMESLNSFFAKKNYELKSLEKEKELENFILTQNAISGKEEDLAYLASLYIGADIYVKFTGDLSSKEINVQLNAYESTTGQTIGSSASKQKISNTKETQKFIQIAATDAARQLDSKLHFFYQAQKKSTQYKVMMNLAGDFDEDFIEDIHEQITMNIPELFQKVIFNVMTEKTVDMTVYANPARYSDSQAIYSTIRAKLKSVVGVKKTNITKKLIFMDLK
ncbi:DUF6175 family protein [uncultured Fibrobacter sp.]|uniref:DUF6175 family protein n=1 Tax=uncultured Fibrobacter sp. TaxID=261512 RepID=UPI0028061360|nr:DUF6175 family protein [uncultured Fibrobacter sp.]